MRKKEQKSDRSLIARSRQLIVGLRHYCSSNAWREEIESKGVSRDLWAKTLQQTFLSFLLLTLAQTVVFAEHEPDHRYLVSGYVRNEVGVPMGGVDVLLEHKGGEKKKATTNSDGYYEVRFHLHNPNLGDEILVTVGEETKTHKVQFDPEDGLAFRGGDVDFGAPGKAGASAWIYLTGISLAVMSYLVYRMLFQKGRGQQKRQTGNKSKGNKKKKN